MAQALADPKPTAIAEAKTTTEKGEEILVKIDQTALIDYFEKRLKEVETKLSEAKVPDGGRGSLETRLGKNASALIEQFRSIKNNKPLTEQWSVVIPNYTSKEVSAHLRDYVFVSEQTQGEPGDVVYIPYCKDLDFEILAAVGNAFNAETTGLISNLATTLYEAGAWSDIPYDTIEKIDQNLLDVLNSTFAVAAVRAEDKALVLLLEACTATNFAGDIGRKTGSAKFYAANISTAIGKLLAAGKAVTPNECVLYITAKPYGALLDELASSQVIAFARADIIQKGLVESFLGVGIVIGGYAASQQRTNAATGTMELTFLMRGKRCLALAPKRDLLIETDRQIKERKLRVTASHTFGKVLLDAKSAVRIWTSQGTMVTGL